MSKGEIALLVLAALQEFVKGCDRWGLESVQLDSIKTLLALQDEYETADKASGDTG